MVGDKEFFCILYADDLVIMSENAYVLQKLLNGLNDYCNACYLKINASKSKVMVFRKGGNLARSDRFFLENKQIEIVDSFKFLGLTFTNRGTWGFACKKLGEQANKAVFSLR